MSLKMIFQYYCPMSSKLMEMILSFLTLFEREVIQQFVNFIAIVQMNDVFIENKK